MSYTLLKFQRAIHELTAAGPQRERLINAYRNNLTYLETEDLPELLHGPFTQFRSQITRLEPAGDKGRVIVTVEAMNDHEISAMVEKIISMYETMLRNQN